ncbi:hypothetical protein [Vibrio parahaemolyticus]|uniref:hypothetical protein n=1 Tax=Vibrio parahaemolyticus TaxID=670 RepID=UPI001869A1B4|nr:hypothetical protein [Vibrio parahaemolyticus]MBE3844555.1 hypothetical protein [Vibrio parahaemolyticus]MBE3945605.1 hypothetical protein [Vibrio parahaemolyticus]MBE4120708.1 hypothetical protein [Vibrio parahaemolyticus]MBE4781393.1 hypothetical protein [Vibrio parahaemolyticus]MEA5290544.1 hypothetical protein [Vibrio parahaemolyticus]
MKYWIVRIKTWYQGESVLKEIGSPGNILLLGIANQRHWTAKVVGCLVGFFTKNWQWLIALLAPLIVA